MWWKKQKKYAEECPHVRADAEKKLSSWNDTSTSSLEEGEDGEEEKTTQFGWKLKKNTCWLSILSIDIHGRSFRLLFHCEKVKNVTGDLESFVIQILDPDDSGRHDGKHLNEL